MSDNDLLDAVEVERTYKFREWPLRLWFVMLVIGIVFRVMHWPGASILIIVSAAGLSAWSMTDIIFLKRSRRIITILSFLGIFWFIFLLWGAYYNGGHPYNNMAVYITVVVFSVYFFVYYLLKKYARFYKK